MSVETNSADKKAIYYTDKNGKKRVRMISVGDTSDILDKNTYAAESVIQELSLKRLKSYHRRAKIDNKFYTNTLQYEYDKMTGKKPGKSYMSQNKADFIIATIKKRRAGLKLSGPKIAKKLGEPKMENTEHNRMESLGLLSESAYTGKHPGRISSVSGMGRGVVLAVTNGGTKHLIRARDTGGKMPRTGNHIDDYKSEPFKPNKIKLKGFSGNGDSVPMSASNSKHLTSEDTEYYNDRVNLNLHKELYEKVKEFNPSNPNMPRNNTREIRDSTPQDKIDVHMSKSTKDWMNAAGGIQNTINPVADIYAAMRLNQKSYDNPAKAAPMRPGDNPNGDKKIVGKNNVVSDSVQIEIDGEILTEGTNNFHHAISRYHSERANELKSSLENGFANQKYNALKSNALLKHIEAAGAHRTAASNYNSAKNRSNSSWSNSAHDFSKDANNADTELSRALREDSRVVGNR